MEVLQMLTVKKKTFFEAVSRKLNFSIQNSPKNKLKMIKRKT